MRIFFLNIDNKTQIFNFENAAFTISDLGKQFDLNMGQVYFTSNGRPLQYSTLLSGYESLTIEARVRLLGGKGGFGSLLKGQPAVKKRTKNFDACRDISGRRIRHVNQEKQLIEWQQKKEEEERIINQSNTGNSEQIKKNLKEDKRNEIVKENNRFFEEDNHTKHAVEKSLKFLNNKRNRDKYNKSKQEQSKPQTNKRQINIEELKIKDDVSKDDLLDEILAL